MERSERKDWAALVSHPDLQGLPAILEVPGHRTGSPGRGPGQGAEALGRGESDAFPWRDERIRAGAGCGPNDEKTSVRPDNF